MKIQGANVAHFAKVKPEDYVRTKFTYAFHLVIPRKVAAVVKAKKLLPEGFRLPLSQNINFTKDSSTTVLIPYIENLNVSRPSASDIEYTDGGGKHKETSGRVLERIQIQGESGFLAAKDPKRVDFLTDLRSGYVRIVKQLNDNLQQINAPNVELTNRGNRSGYMWFHRLSRLFEVFWAIEKGLAPREREGFELLWVNTRDDHCCIIEPDEFAWSRNIDKQRHTYAFSLTMTVIELYDDAALHQHLSSLDKESRKDDIFTGLAKARDVITAVNGTISNLVNFTDGNIKKAMTLLSDSLGLVTGAINGVFDIGEDVARLPLSVFATIESTSTSITDLFERAGVGDINNNSVVRTWNNAFDSMTQTMDLIKRTWVSTFDQKNDLNSRLAFKQSELMNQIPQDFNQSHFNALDMDATNSGGFDFGASLRSDAGPTFDTNMFTDATGLSETGWWAGFGPFDALASETLRNNEDIFQLAKRVMGDINAWALLVEVNDLQYPYIVSETVTRPPVGTLRPGDPVKVPVLVGGDERLTQIQAHRLFPSTSGDVQFGTSEVVYDNVRKPMVPEEWVAFTLEITSGTGEGQKRLITDNDRYSFNVNEPFSPAPDSTSSYVVYYDPAEPVVSAHTDDLSRGVDIPALRYENGTYDWDDKVLNDLVTGYEGAVQSLQIGVDTHLGAHPFRRDDGMVRLEGKRLDADMIAIHSVYAKRTILADERVTGIGNTTYAIDEAKSVLYYEVEVFLDDGNSSKVRGS